MRDADKSDADQPLLAVMIAAARAASEAIMAIYRESDFGVMLKDDHSPVTRADLAAHDIIARQLQVTEPALPLLSEEAPQAPWQQRREWRRYWLVDPLDGTREFINRNDEFTVNIALVEEGVAVLGVILAPVTGTLYSGQRLGRDPRHWQAWKEEADGRRSRISSRPAPLGADGDHFTLAVSRRRGTWRSDRLADRLAGTFGTVHHQVLGSSLKMCLVAEGRADLYTCFGPTGEWDTAAGQAILEAAGGSLCELDGKARRYNQHAEPINPSIYAAGDVTVDWPALLASATAAGDTTSASATREPGVDNF